MDAERPRTPSPSRQWARGAGGVFFIRSLAVLLAYGSQLLVIQLIGPERFGEFVFAIATLGILMSIGSLGIPQAIVRFVPDYLATKRWGLLSGFNRWTLRVTMLCSILLGALLAAGVLIFRARIPDGLWQTLLVAAAACPVSVYFSLETSKLRALKRVWMASMWDFILRPLMFLALLSIGFCFLHLATTSAWTLGLNLAATVAAAAVVAWFAHATLRRASEPGAPECLGKAWLNTSVLFLLMTTFGEIMTRTPVLMIGIFGKMVESGMFSASIAISGLVAFALVASNTMLSPMISQFHAEGRREELQRVVTWAARLTTLATLLLFAVVAIAGRFALSLYNPAFTQAYVPLLILAGGQFVNSFCGPVGILLAMTGHERVLTKVLGASAFLNVALCAVLIPFLGLTGGAIASAGVMVLWNVVLAVLVVRRLGIWPLPFRIGARGNP